MYSEIQTILAQNADSLVQTLDDVAAVAYASWAGYV